MFIPSSNLYLVTVEQETVLDDNSVPLGTDTYDTMAKPTLAKEHILEGLPAIFVPFENEFQMLEEQGSRSYTVWNNLFNIRGTMRRYVIDNLIQSACLGRADYSLSKLSPTLNNLPKFTIRIYHHLKDSAGQVVKKRVPEAGDTAAFMIELSNLTFLTCGEGFDSDRRKITEDIAFVAENISISFNWTKGEITKDFKLNVTIIPRIVIIAEIETIAKEFAEDITIIPTLTEIAQWIDLAPYKEVSTILKNLVSMSAVIEDIDFKNFSAILRNTVVIANLQEPIDFKEKSTLLTKTIIYINLEEPTDKKENSTLIKKVIEYAQYT